VKLVRREQHSSPLRRWLAEHGDARPITSVLAEVEVWRAVRRRTPGLFAAIPPVLARLSLLDLSAAVRSIAANVGEPQLRALDAIHLATAMLVRSELACVVSYDTRLLDGARGLGLEVASPGVSA
jgi:predicted nucleic acid-binding protein